MKPKLIFPLLLLLIIFSSCKTQRQNENPLVGVWQLIGVDGRVNDHSTIPSGKIPGTISYKVFSTSGEFWNIRQRQQKEWAEVWAKGTYTITSESTYTEKLKHFSDDTKGDEGQNSRLTYQLSPDRNLLFIQWKLPQSGVEGREAWKRIDKMPSP
ncbi:MAG: DUF4488 domain-containing protein [Prevotella sp.]|nr:DUF4488 domain-containing protein [Prevotella sp.]